MGRLILKSLLRYTTIKRTFDINLRTYEKISSIRHWKFQKLFFRNVEPSGSKTIYYTKYEEAISDELIKLGTIYDIFETTL